MASIVSNYAVLQGKMHQIYKVRDTDTKAWIRGMAARMESFEFLFGLVLGEMLLCYAMSY